MAALSSGSRRPDDRWWSRSRPTGEATRPSVDDSAATPGSRPRVTSSYSPDTVSVSATVSILTITPGDSGDRCDSAVTAVVVPTGRGAYSCTCVRSLGRRGIETIVASEVEGVSAAASRYCTESVRVADPEVDLLAYRDDLLALAERPSVATVIPVRPTDTYVLSRFQEAFQAVTSVFVPTLAQLDTVFDRVRLFEAARDAGVPVPRTESLDAVTDWSRPQVVKSRYNLLTSRYLCDRDESDAELVKSVDHLAAGERPDDSLRDRLSHTPIVQEYVPSSDEYMVAALYDHGEPLATFQHRQIRGNSYTGGGGVYRRSVAIPELGRVAHDLLEALEWHGLACIEYMRHAETGEFVLTEINPRMWQSLPSTVRAGADFPYYYWLAATGRPEAIDADYELGVGSHLLDGELGYLTSVLREESPLVPSPSVPGAAWAILASCLREPHFDYLAMDDPGPFLRGVVNKLRPKG